ncbi:hypothetical protein HCN51_15300 [Nonomuraea sp. FMUSA5-5]|uniref:EfeO-type cupredoxin-like domain-containing protein n=1 Tax=Nonomuraea composti TaxID=2720023 RepID=A0ABX1B2V6_9ACTN|nr:hypothetical protein [Nonomuraea sp. FMUSA5-5]NJP90807.1 hypothetical protein [Nonomuraea sp. FMUSA5-5]
MRAGLLAGALASVLVAGCGPLSQTHRDPGNSHEVATGAPSGQADARITIAGGRVEPPPGWLEVGRGRQVSITVTSDVADEVHVHGYDLVAELRPGVPATLRFTADLTGVFQVETHRSELVLTQLAVR